MLMPGHHPWATSRELLAHTSHPVPRAQTEPPPAKLTDGTDRTMPRTGVSPRPTAHGGDPKLRPLRYTACPRWAVDYGPPGMEPPATGTHHTPEHRHRTVGSCGEHSQGPLPAHSVSSGHVLRHRAAPPRPPRKLRLQSWQAWCVHTGVQCGRVGTRLHITWLLWTCVFTHACMCHRRGYTHMNEHT